MSTTEVLSEVLGKKLLGELLTIVDSSIADKSQREATKSLVRQAVQRCSTELHSRLDAAKEG